MKRIQGVKDFGRRTKSFNRLRKLWGIEENISRGICLISRIKLRKLME
jgi:hypothetical protein